MISREIENPKKTAFFSSAVMDASHFMQTDDSAIVRIPQMIEFFRIGVALICWSMFDSLQAVSIILPRGVLMLYFQYGKKEDKYDEKKYLSRK